MIIAVPPDLPEPTQFVTEPYASVRQEEKLVESPSILKNQVLALSTEIEPFTRMCGNVDIAAEPSLSVLDPSEIVYGVRETARIDDEPDTTFYKVPRKREPIATIKSNISWSDAKPREWKISLSDDSDIA